MGFGHAGSEGQEPPPAEDTATVPSGPVEAYAQASAAAGAAGAPASVQASVTGAKTRRARTSRVGSGRRTTEIMRPGGPAHAAVPG